MEDEIIVHEKVFIPWVKEFPFEETEKWGRSYFQNIPKNKKAIRKAVLDDETYRKRIAEPGIDAVRRTLRDGMVNRKGLPKEAILKLTEAKLNRKGMAEKHWENVKKGYREFDQGDLNNAMVKHHLKKCFGVERFRDAIKKALDRLTPFIQPAKQGEFKKKLGNQILHSGKLISELAYHPEYRKLENDKINALINEYILVPLNKGGRGVVITPLIPLSQGGIREDIVPFSTGGPSHCDFVLVPESVRPIDSKEVLDFKYKIYERFLGEAQANRVRDAWTVKDYSGIQINPNEYIGHPEKPAYFDMELDIQVSKKD